MSLPDYQTLMLPLLQLAGDGAEHKFRDAIDDLAVRLGLSDEDRNELLPSGNQPVFDNRVGWARTYLKQAGLLDSARRGYFSITERGLRLLEQKPQKIDLAVLENYDEFRAFKNRKRDKEQKNEQVSPVSSDDSDLTPEDALADAYQKLRSSLEIEVLSALKAVSPNFFERIVVDLLVRMGYGGNRQDAGKALGKSGDGGIDGIIKEDRLGLDVIYIQAKRWEGTVGRPEIQKFAGALQGQRARKGVFITTSAFTAEAKDYASMIESKIILIDGDQLSRLMVENGVGVATVGHYELKKLDSDYFDDD